MYIYIYHYIHESLANAIFLIDDIFNYRHLEN